MSATLPRATTRERLSVERIVEEALALARQDRTRGISMRPLAARFGVSATALYGHISSRDALLSLMLDHILEEVPGLPTELPWDATLRLGAMRMRDAFGPYPQLAFEALAGKEPTPLIRTRGELLVGRLVAAGFDGEEAGLAVACWGRWTLSYLAVAGQGSVAADTGVDRAFEAGVDYLLDGLRRQLGDRATT